MSEVLSWGVGIISALGGTTIFIIILSIIVIKKIKKITGPIRMHVIKKQNKELKERISKLEIAIYQENRETTKWKNKALKIVEPKKQENVKVRIK